MAAKQLTKVGKNDMTATTAVVVSRPRPTNTMITGVVTMIGIDRRATATGIRPRSSHGASTKATAAATAPARPSANPRAVVHSVVPRAPNT